MADPDATPFANPWHSEPTETDLAKRELAEALRQLLHSLGSSGATPDEIRAVAEGVLDGHRVEVRIQEGHGRVVAPRQGGDDRQALLGRGQRGGAGQRRPPRG